jgi:hypothetical protein
MSGPTFFNFHAVRQTRLPKLLQCGALTFGLREMTPYSRYTKELNHD